MHINVTVSKVATIYDIKQKIHEQQVIPVKMQHITSNGQKSQMTQS